MTTATTPPFRRGLPWVGQTLRYVRDPLAMMREQYEQCGPVSEMNFIGARWTVLLGPDACEAALRNADKAFMSGPGWGRLVGPFFDRGLMLLDLDEHHRHRRIMQAAFTRDRIAGYTAALQDPVADALAAWRPSTSFTVYPALKSLTLDVATDVFMGGVRTTDPGEIDRVNAAFIDCVQAATAFVRYDVPGTRWGRALRSRRLLEEFIARQLPGRREGDGTDLLSVLCRLRDDDGSAFSDTDVVNHMIFLLMAAHDTSTITSSTMIQLLGQHPEWQERCRREAMALPERPTLDDLDGLVDIPLVMKEALRLVPPVPVLARRTVKDTEVLGHHVPADRYVSVMLHLSHHLPELWTDPERFDPERFADDRREDKSHRHAWDPFGGGVHKCLGMFFAGAEVSTILVHLLRRHRWHVDPTYRAPLSYVSLPFPKDGLPVRLERLDPAPARRPARTA